MTDAETDALVEAMARALAEASDDYDGDVLQFVPYLDDARALLPIITAHTAAAVAAERERASRQARGAVVIYTKGYGPGDGDSAINQQENPSD